jgi:hypothetical protein
MKPLKTEIAFATPWFELLAKTMKPGEAPYYSLRLPDYAAVVEKRAVHAPRGIFFSVSKTKIRPEPEPRSPAGMFILERPLRRKPAEVSAAPVCERHRGFTS